MPMLRDASSEVVWPVLGVVLLCLLVVALLTVIRRLRRDAAERRQQREEARRRHPATSAPLLIDAPAAGEGGSNGHRAVPSPTAEAAGATGSANGSQALPSRTTARIEAGLYDATGRRTADPFEAVRGELIAYGVDGAELARTALELPGARPKVLSSPAVPAGAAGPGGDEPAPRPPRRRQSRRRRVRPEVSSRAGGSGSG